MATFPIAAMAQEQDPAFVQVKATKLRSSARHWATAKGDLSYGDQLTVLEQLPQWVRVRTKSGKEGFVPQSALTSQRVSLKGSTDKSLLQADASDVALAGKGFSPEVEKQYAASNKSLNYAAVDRMEKVRIADSEVLAFIKAGKLNE
jgi:SH3-like domain-containing protein